MGHNDPLQFISTGWAEESQESMSLDQQTQVPILAGGLDTVFSLGPLGLHDDDLGILLLCFLRNRFMDQMKQGTSPASAKSPYIHPATVPGS